MAKTVIDQVVIQAGWDPAKLSSGMKKSEEDLSKFKKTASKTDQKTSQESTKASKEKGKHTDKEIKDQKRVISGLNDVQKAVRKTALEFTGLFVGVKSVGGLIGWLASLSTGLRQIGLTAGMFGFNVGDLRDLQKASEIFGGTSEGITNTMIGFKQMMFNLKYMGEVSPQYIALHRFGVRFQDENGKLLQPHQLLLNAANWFKKDMQGGDSLANATFKLSSMGFDKSAILMIEAGAHAIDKVWASEKKQNQQSAETIRKNAQMVIAYTRVHQQIVNLARSLLIDAAPAVTKFFGVLSKGVMWLEGHQNDIGKEFEKFDKWVTNPKTKKEAVQFFDEVASSAKNLAKVLSIIAPSITDISRAWKWMTTPIKSPLAPAAVGADLRKSLFGSSHKKMTLGLRSNNPGNLRWNNKELKFGTEDEGIVAAWRQLNRDYETHKLHTISQIIGNSKWGWANKKSGNDTSAYIGYLSKFTGIGANQKLSSNPVVRRWQLQRIMGGMFNLENYPGAVSKKTLDQALMSSGRLPTVHPTPTSVQHINHTTANTTHIHVSAINVSGVRDAHEAAAQIIPALRRWSATQVDSAMVG